MAHHDQSRKILERIRISSKLTLQSPAHFGSGVIRGDALVDMSLLLDEVDESPCALIPGTTIAGALRSYLGERLRGYGEKELDRSAVSDLFGPWRESDDESAAQSLLITEDALSTQSKLATTLRDGVRIEAKTGTAYQDESGGAKFDVELLEAGTTFDLNFELLLTQSKDAAKMIPFVMAAFYGLEKGEIRLGLRKRRGYGRCRAHSWQVSRFQMNKSADLCVWLETGTHEHKPGPKYPSLTDAFTHAFANVFEEKSLSNSEPVDMRSQFSITATFGLEHSSLMIRSGFGETDKGADFVQLQAVDENGQGHPTIPGTSWAGVVRHRALRIANTVAQQTGNLQEVEPLIESLFGRGPTKPEADEARQKGKAITGKASRASLDETYVKQGQSLYQTRVRIDRFTGGAFESALFEEAPVYGTDKTRVAFQLHVRNPQKYEIGLLLLVLKDLWTGDLPVGGEVAVGRGRLTGLDAWLCVQKHDEPSTQLTLQRDLADLGLTVEQRQKLQRYVDALWVQLGLIPPDEEVDNGK